MIRIYIKRERQTCQKVEFFDSPGDTATKTFLRALSINMYLKPNDSYHFVIYDGLAHIVQSIPCHRKMSHVCWAGASNVPGGFVSEIVKLGWCCFGDVWTMHDFRQEYGTRTVVGA